ncbi:MAG: SprB repeat-containing protein [Saprospiraceae bacterium]
MRKYVFFVLLVLGQLSLIAQNPCNVYFEATNVTGTTVDIDVKADGFTNVVGFQMYLQWDLSVLERDTVIYTNSELSGIEFGYEVFGDNMISSQWTSNFQNVDGITLASGTTLFTIRYDFSGDPCDETSFTLFDPTPLKSLITYSDDSEYSINFDSSTFQIPGSNCGGSQGGSGTGLIIGTVTENENAEFCLPITVDSFKNVDALQFKITWDPSVVSFQGWNNINGGTNALVNVIGGDTLIFIMDSPDYDELPDGSTLIEICFLAVGQNGDMSSVKFIDLNNFEIDPDRPYYLTDGKVTIGEVYDPVTFIIKDANPDKSETVCLDVLGVNFTDIESFKYIVHWDSTVLEWVGLGTVNNISISDGSSGHIYPYGADKLKFLWYTSSGTGISLPDSTILFQMCFNVIGDCNKSTDVEIIGESSYVIEVTANEEEVEYLMIPGTVTVKCGIQTEYTSENVTCNGSTDGRIIVTLEGNVNVSDYYFEWYKVGSSTPISEGVGKNSLLGVGPGTYYYYIYEVNTPTIDYTSGNIVITEPSAWAVTANITNVTCDENGTINLSVSGQNSPYTYSWNPSSLGDTNNPTGLIAGNYAVSIYDSKGCSSFTKSYTVGSDVAAIVISEDFTDIGCKDANDGAINLSVSGGCSPYTVLWSDGTSANNFSRTGLAAGNYTATITDSKGNLKVSSTFTVTNPSSALTVNGTVDNANGSISLNVSGGSGTGTYTYSWTGPGNFTSNVEDLTGRDC